VLLKSQSRFASRPYARLSQISDLVKATVSRLSTRYLTFIDMNIIEKFYDKINGILSILDRLSINGYYLHQSGSVQRLLILLQHQMFLKP